MGSIISSIISPPKPKSSPLPALPPLGVREDGGEEAGTEQRRRRRGSRSATVATSPRGALLSQNLSPRRKSLLGD
ncbi:MAG: hypothetical protein HOO00_07765 [Rhodospirillaceae bacterium]|nr:hypothetical protein [Rhodospirillaceae bacterium]MBT5373879.1 hypothetical protein [Rhodospirillaceae bacterium]MBT5659323.1 hypothetical protein [Rhodospirillaceae bacterium]MBT5752165.1 hypothetical protein [Rhodospirillaceae bacterium]